MVIRQKSGKTLSVSRVKRKQKRRKRRLLEANDSDWARWDAEAKLQNLNFAEMARRALDGFCTVSAMRRGEDVWGVR